MANARPPASLAACGLTATSEATPDSSIVRPPHSTATAKRQMTVVARLRWPVGNPKRRLTLHMLPWEHDDGDEEQGEASGDCGQGSQLTDACGISHPSVCTGARTADCMD
mmetsp:Transcript_93511/g.238031  ORF Transcript_93511/g.238031 Transcript_93511/m.238031 type:complete len:110 (+) Transcript_93511:1696-2025(+)